VGVSLAQVVFYGGDMGNGGNLSNGVHGHTIAR